MWRGNGSGASASLARRRQVIIRTSHVTRHTSPVTRHTSHITRHTSHVTRHAAAVSSLLQKCVLESNVVMSSDTRDKLTLDHDVLLQTTIAMNEWQRLATSFFDPVAALPMGKSTALLWDSVLSRCLHPASSCRFT